MTETLEERQGKALRRIADLRRQQEQLALKLALAVKDARDLGVSITRICEVADAGRDRVKVWLEAAEQGVPPAESVRKPRRATRRDRTTQ